MNDPNKIRRSSRLATLRAWTIPIVVVGLNLILLLIQIKLGWR